MVSPRKFDVRYKTWAALSRDCSQQLAMKGLFLRTSEGLDGAEQFSPVELSLTVPSGESFDLAGQVLQVIPGQGVAVQLGDDTVEIDTIQSLCEPPPPDRGDPPSEEPRVRLAKERQVSKLKLASDPQELRRQLAELNVNEKRQVALRCRREVRLLLIKDRIKAVHPFVIKNPAITVDEIELFAKMPTVNPDALRMIAANREWLRVTGVVRALVLNPKTPIQDAIRLLDKLPIGDIRMIAKRGNVRMPIQQAARKKVT